MPDGVIHVAVSELLAEHLADGPPRAALADLAALAGAKLALARAPDSGSTILPAAAAWPAQAIRFGADDGAGSSGAVWTAGGEPRTARAAAGIAALLRHMQSREVAVADMAGAMMCDYEELNMLYRILPMMAGCVNDAQIGRLLVDEAARMLDCRRVSLLALNESRTEMHILAARGVPPEAIAARIPAGDGVAWQVLRDEGLLIVDDAEQRSGLPPTRGSYDAAAFAVIRVPLAAHGEPLGVLTATEKSGGGEFTARDRKLLEGLSAVSASALLNCRFHARITAQMVSTIRALASAVDAKDHYTHDHSARVASLCVAMAKRIGESDAERLHRIELSGLLHDIGKIGIPDEILNKRGRLDAAEYAIVQQHVEIGAKIVGCVPDLHDVARAILHHHERFDGGGYPSRLKGEEIPVGSRLIAVADAYDSLVTDRPYRAATPFERALGELERCKASHFDPSIVDALSGVVAEDARWRPERAAELSQFVTAVSPA